MVTTNVILSVSEESEEEGRDSGPRTSLICISTDYKKLMFAVPVTEERLCARDISPSETTKSRTHTGFSGNSSVLL